MKKLNLREGKRWWAPSLEGLQNMRLDCSLRQENNNTDVGCLAFTSLFLTVLSFLYTLCTVVMGVGIQMPFYHYSH